MSARTVKLLHTCIWVIMVCAIGYIWYCGLTNTLSPWLFVAVGLLVIEILVLMVNQWRCPFTILAQQVDPDWKDGDDLYIPRWLAKHNKSIFGGALVLGLLLVLYRMIL